VARPSRRWHDEIILYLGVELKVAFSPPLHYGPLPVVLPSPHDFARAIDDLMEDYRAEADTLGLDEALIAKLVPTIGPFGDEDAKIKYVTWDACSFLGRRPTASESASISRALRELAEQNPAPVARRRRPGEKRKRLIRLTATGKLRFRLLTAAVLQARELSKGGQTR